MQAAELLHRQVPWLDARELRHFVRSLLDRRDVFLATVDSAGSPLYVIDVEAINSKARHFRNAFATVLPDLRIYYALKSNSHPTIATTLVQEGFGLDVSSGLELETALECGAREIVFSGPGKRPDELAFAAEHADRVTVLLDSFRELEKLERAAKRAQVLIRAGVRLATDDTGIWRKFGIPLARLQSFFHEAHKCEQVDLCGLQFHLSWNLNPEAQVVFIARLGAALRELDQTDRESIKFLDIGGGFWPEQGEWLQPGAAPSGVLKSEMGEATSDGLSHYKNSACSITEFADRISAALNRHVPDDMNCTICLEPGRWLCHNAMHILLTVTDVKSADVVITDGGTNAVGWERFETDYFPIINLTRPSLREHECLVAGSLCTPHDLWGYSYFGKTLEEGDILLIPNQGAYTYSLRQEFIKPLPVCAELSMLPDGGIEKS